MARYGYHLWVNTCDHGTSWLCLHHYLGRCVFSIFSGTTNHDPKNPPKMAKQICEFQMNNFTSYKIVFMIKLSSYLLYFILLCLLNQIIFFNYIIDIIYYILYVLYILYILFYIFIYIYHISNRSPVLGKKNLPFCFGSQQQFLPLRNW